MTTLEEGALTVLHVDDDPALGELVQLYLERDEVGPECTVRTETSPVTALDVLRSDGGTFDCVISDYRMPEMNGIEFVEAVRGTHSELPVLLFSGEETAEIAAEIIRAGLSDYLRKGTGTDQYTILIRRVEHAVESDGQFDPEAETELDGVGVVGKHWSELHPEDEVEHIRTHVLPVVRDGGKWSGRSEGLRADGSTFTESKMVTALDDGRLLTAVSYGLV